MTSNPLHNYNYGRDSPNKPNLEKWTARMATEVSSYPTERELTRSEEEEQLLREIREEKERLWVEISVRGNGTENGLQ